MQTDGLVDTQHNKENLGRHHISFGVAQILRGLAEAYGLDLSNANFTETPDRVARAYDEIFGGLRDTEKQVTSILSKAFPCTSSELVVQKDILTYSMCPHHLLPVEYRIAVAYIPGEGGKVLGISKLARLTELLARRPVLQEQLVGDIVDALMRLEGCDGAACIAHGRHFCMVMRGARQSNAVTVTSAVRGAFLEEGSARNEWLALARSF